MVNHHLRPRVGANVRPQVSRVYFTVDPDCQLVDFDRALYGTQGVNMINARYITEPILGWRLRHEIVNETRDLEGIAIPVTRVIMHFSRAEVATPTIAITYVYGSRNPDWELSARFRGAQAVASASEARSLANRLLDAVLRETAARIGA